MGNAAGVPVWQEIGTTPYIGGGHEDAEILIVGGGPVGLTLALDLGLKGRKVVLINKFDFISAGSKAICFAKRTLDIWTRLGVGQTMIDKGVIWNVGKVFCGDEENPRYQFDMLLVKNQQNPGFINLQQYHAEAILIAALDDLPNVDMRWGHEAIGVENHEQSALLTVKTADQDYYINTQWLIACDGSRSSVRDMMDLDFEGRIFEDNFLIADVKFKEERPSERWFWFDPPFNPGQSALLHKQPDDVWRLDFQLGWDIDRKACILPENVEPFVRGMLGDGIEFTEEWYSVYTFQCRRMRNFVHGRTIFAGDSAHLVSPFGARGCNGGVADADNLAWKLNAILEGAAPASLIQSYDYEAIVTADENILYSSRSTDFMSPKNKASTILRDAVLEMAVDYEFARPFVNSGRLSTPVSYPDSQLNTCDIDSWNGGILPGSPALDAMIGNEWLLMKLSSDFALIGCNIDIVIEGLNVIDVAKYGDGPASVITRYGLKPGSAYLLRPDQYVAARWHNVTQTAVKAAIQKAMGA